LACGHIQDVPSIEVTPGQLLSAEFRQAGLATGSAHGETDVAGFN
jgi:hypothetical protein